MAKFIADNYQVWKEYKARMRRLGVTIVDLVPLFGLSPGAIGGRLNGYAPLTVEMRVQLEDFLNEVERKRENADAKKYARLGGERY